MKIEITNSFEHQLPFYLRVFATEENGSFYIDIESTIHVNKKVRLPTSYISDYFRDCFKSVCNEVFHKVLKIYGLKIETFAR